MGNINFIKHFHKLRERKGGWGKENFTLQQLYKQPCLWIQCQCFFIKREFNNNN